MGKLKTADEIVRERASKALAALAKIEEVCDGICEDIEITHASDDSPETRHARTTIRRTRDFAWALRNFPLFDPSCLAMLREVEVAVESENSFLNGRPRSFNGKLFLPTFGVKVYGGSDVASITIGIGNNTGGFGFCLSGFSKWQAGAISHDLNVLQKNRDRFREFYGGNASDIRLTANCPPVPHAVAARVDTYKGRFDDINVAWEAEWVPAPARDPLIIGVIMDHCFLLDQWDATKLERYVSSEFTTRAK